MAKNPTHAPRVLLFLTGGAITAFITIYGVCMGWTSWTNIVLYFFTIFYVFYVCRTINTITYTAAGSASTIALLFFSKNLDPISAIAMTFVTVLAVLFVADVTVSFRTRYIPVIEVPSDEYHPTRAEDPASSRKPRTPTRSSGGKDISKNPTLSRREKKILLRQEWRNKK